MGTKKRRNSQEEINIEASDFLKKRSKLIVRYQELSSHLRSQIEKQLWICS